MAKKRLGPWQWEVVPTPAGRTPKPPPFDVVYVLKDLPFKVTKRYTGIESDMKRTFRIAPDGYSPAWRLDLYDFGTWEALTSDEYKTPQEAAMALDAYLKSDGSRFTKNADAGAPKRVTIYTNSPMGSIAKFEGVLTGFDHNGVGGVVNYIPKGARKERGLMTYYHHFIMVVEGWGKPEPEGGFLPSQPGSTPGVSVSRGRYRSNDPRWISDFMDGPGKALHPIILIEEGRIKKDTSGVRTASVANQVLRYASTLPKGSNERRALLEILASTSKTSLTPQYHGLLTQLVQHVDGMEGASKKHADRAKNLIDDLKEMVDRESAFGGNDSNRTFGARQAIQDMEQALQTYTAASDQLGHAYDELNKWWSKWGPK
jgi:hypothetical protein